MKLLLILWGLPVTLLTSWYTLSYYDINFGTQFLSRDMHDLVFLIYGHMLGMEPEAIPPLVLKAIVIDSLIVFGIALLRWKRRPIGAAIRAFFRRGENETSRL